MKIEKLDPGHDVAGFDCGNEALNHFLKRFALAGQLANASQTYVAIDGGEVIGFHTLLVGAVQHGDAPERMRKGLPRHPVPVMILARPLSSMRRTRPQEPVTRGIALPKGLTTRYISTSCSRI